jgi:hypothetical protein
MEKGRGLMAANILVSAASLDSRRTFEAFSITAKKIRVVVAIVGKL